MCKNQQPEERSDLLFQAINLCTTLCDVLERLGHSRFTQSDHRPAVSNVYELESTLHDRLRQLDEKRNEALAPVSRLPDDILRLIIQHGHDDEPHEVYPIGISLVRRVSHTSRRWRTIVLEMASVWTYMRFSSPAYLADEDFKPIHPCYGSARALNDIYTCNLERSKQHLLKVELQLLPYYVLPTMMKEYLQFCSNRVAELTLKVDAASPDVLKAIIPCITYTRKTLRCLRLELRQSVGLPAPTMNLPDMFGELLSCDLPRLVEVELYWLPLPLGHRPEYIAFLRCRRLLLESNPTDQYTAARLLALLRCAPQLEQLHLNTLLSPDFEVADPEVQLPHVLLPELRSISCSSTFRARDTFGRLLTPKLESLSMNVRGGFQSHERQETYVADLLEFLAASSVQNGAPLPVKQLTIEGPILKNLERIALIIPGIETLRASFDHEWDFGEEQDYSEVLNKLVPTEYSASESQDVAQSPLLCPQLKVLESLSLATPRHIQSLMTFAARRRSCGNPLTRIRILDWAPVSNPTLGMPANPSDQYRLEKELAKEVEVLECGNFRWEWTEGGRWRRERTVRRSEWGRDRGWFSA
ncbi:hypothetical protein DACRYDRAFT_106139 [Dacryopinax primogenitus]|uniref:Uncharacterized protein n=1 Tax=Dacryopinax primogenitus (strain DJM 731) TaxID=1858805 RepID=M5FY21_DACPD|nr:uncharacterized protein DACRYDRAFT_106139 [Dacryopinax primogenitus]EJU02961.1 hypothetical protein DACRYDRAFT_106139 [Dacryopinax primogenitus]